MSRRKKQPVTQDLLFVGAAIPNALNTRIVGAGPPTGAAAGDHGLLQLEATSELQVAQYDFNDLLGWDIDDLQYVDFWVELAGDLDANEQLTIGVGSAHNDDARSIAERAVFTIDGGAVAIKVNTDDGTNDTTVTSNMTLTNSVVTMFRINLKTGQQQLVGQTSKAGKGSVRFECSNNQGQLATVDHPGTHFDMSDYSGGLQPIVQLRKSTGTTTNSLKVHRITAQLLVNG